MPKSNLLSGIINLISVAFALLIVCTCQNKHVGHKPSKGVLSLVKPSYNNNFQKDDTAKSSGSSYAPGPINKYRLIGLPMVRAYEGNEEFVGNSISQGKYVLADTNRIIFTTSKNKVYEIFAEFPGNNIMAGFGSGNGILEMRHSNSPGPAQDYYRLSSGNDVLLGFVWQTKDKPQSFLGPGGIIIKQNNLSQLPLANETVQVGLTLQSKKLVQNLKEGDYFQIKNNYKILIQTSSYHVAPDPGYDNISGYILHLIIFKI